MVEDVWIDEEFDIVVPKHSVNFWIEYMKLMNKKYLTIHKEISELCDIILKNKKKE